VKRRKGKVGSTMADKIPEIVFIIVGFFMMVFPVMIDRLVNRFQVGPNANRMVENAKLPEARKKDITKKVSFIQYVWTMFIGFLFFAFGWLMFFGVLHWRQ
jgi:hypothetical protein